MQANLNLARTALGAFLLEEETYTGMRDNPQRLSRGLVFVLVVGVLVGAATACGQLSQWAFAPDLNTVQAMVYDHLTQMSWFTMWGGQSRGQFTNEFNQIYNLVWSIVKGRAPSPLALVNILTQPLILLVAWLLYGLVAHLMAKLLGGQGSLGQTLGCTALAAAPQLLNLIQVVPYALAAGVGAWALVCNFTALRTAHGLSGWRALIAALVPLILFALVLTLLAGAGAVIGFFVVRQMGGVR
jgi:hypothetical protein